MVGPKGGGSKTSPDPTQVLSPLPPGEKAAVFYHRLDEIEGTVTSLLQDSLEQREMCVFICRSPVQRVKGHLKALGMDLDRHPSIVLVPLGRTRVDDYSASSIGEQMRTFVQRARAMGYTGARLILNVPEELAVQVPSDRAWQELDRVREELGLTVVCLYDMASLSPELLLKSLASYPKVIMEGVLSRNFYYLPTLDGERMDHQRELYHLLDNIKVEREERFSEEEERSRIMDMNRQLQEEILRRRLVEFSLLQAENNLRTMLDAMTDLVFMVDRELRVTNGNHTFLRYLKDAGLDTSYEGRSVHELFPGASIEGRELFEEVFHHGHPTIVQESIKVDDGLLEVEVRLVPAKMGDKVDRVVVIAHPKTATAHDIEDMWEKAEMLRSELLDPKGPSAGAMEFCPHPVVITDRRGRLFRANQALGRELGWSLEEIMGLGEVTEFLEPFKVDGGPARHQEVNGRTSIPSMMKRKDGSFQKVMCYLAPVGEGDGSRVITIIHHGR